MKTRTLVPPALALALLPLGAGSLSAFVLLSPPRTWDCPVDYTVDNRAGGVPTILDADGGETRVVDAITSAADAWNGAGAGRVIRAHKGSVADFALGDFDPMINLTDPLAACTDNCLAATFTGFIAERRAGSSSFQIVDADIVTNSTDFSWTSEGEDPGGDGCSNEVFIEGVMVHEAGHGLGLDHSPVAGATMRPTVAFCSDGPATIEADDASGLVALYGSAPCGSCDTFTDFIPDGGTQTQPCGGAYFGNAGSQVGFLRGPFGAVFDLSLLKWNGRSWITVASSTTPARNQNLKFLGTAGLYMWSIHSAAGSGTYHFYSSHP